MKRDRSSCLGLCSRAVIAAFVFSILLLTPGPASADPTEQAKALTDRGYQALQAGRNEEAVDLFNHALAAVPGYPEAVTGIEQARAHTQVESGGEPTLIEKIRARNDIRWQRVIASFREAEAEVRDHVINERYELAKQALLRARQVVEAGKEFAEPLSRYETLRAELDALAEFVDAEDRAYQERKVGEIRQEVERKNEERIRELREEKQRRIDQLMEQAFELRKNRDYDGAIKVLDQVVGIDPRNDQARWMRDEWGDTAVYIRQHEAFEDKGRQTQDLLRITEEDKVPWHQNITYPKNWLEIIARPDRSVSGQEYLTEEDRRLKEQLAARIPVSFEDTPFGEVVQTLADSQKVNITVVWSDLETRNITQDTPVTLTFSSEITLKKALDEILAQLGGSSVELGYVLSDGIIKIASRELLNQEAFVSVYDINDLLMRVPEFTDSPAINIEQTGGGGGAGGGSASQNPFQGGQGGGGGGEDDNRTRRERAEEIVQLIKDTIEPDSWRDQGGSVASIQALEANLVVTQTASAHEQISDLLAQLRKERAIQIAVEARFLTVTANYLEEMGVDLDIILNQGNAGYDRVNNLGEGTALLMPRSFSRLGFTPGVPGVGNALDPIVTPGTNPGANIRQPYNQAVLVPPQSQFLSGTGSRLTPIPIANNVLDLTQTSTTSIPGSLGGGDTPAMQIFGSFLDGIQVDFLLRATQADRRGSGMSAPRLVLFNGQRAWVGVLQEQAYVATVTPVVDENAVAQQPQVQQILTGTILDVAATVSADKRYVTMTLRPGVASLLSLQEFPFVGGAATAATASNGLIQLPNVLRQVIRTTVSVPDGGTLLIGGMKNTEEVELEAGVPVLSKIPVLKRLYSNRSLVKDESVLLILVKPTIIISREAEEEAFPTFGTRG